MEHVQKADASTPPAAKHRAPSYIDTLFSGGIPDLVAWSTVVLVFSVELFMNLRNGEGFMSTAHLAVIGPLWLIGLVFVSIAIIRMPWRRAPDGSPTSDET